jgi:predicted lipoprotein with Yx(FWY)xxD motif
LPGFGGKRRSNEITKSRYTNGDNAMRNRWLVGPGLIAVAVVIAACGSKADPGPSSPAAPASGQANAASGSVTIKSVSTSKGTVLVDAQGHTLYWFAKDTSTKSNCNGSCATYWPPVTGTALAAAGASLPHSFGTIKRADGQTQATYDGHPLYTYTGDTAAGQVNGNGINASGGRWWAATPSGSNLATKKAKKKSSGSGGSGGSGGGGGGW